MQTIAGLAERLDMSADKAVETLRTLQFDIDGVSTEINDEQIDMLIEVDEDPAALDRYLKEIKKKEEQKRKQAERLQKAAQKAAALRRKKSAAAPKPVESKEEPPEEPPVLETVPEPVEIAASEPEQAPEVLEPAAEVSVEDPIAEVVPEAPLAEILPAKEEEKPEVVAPAVVEDHDVAPAPAEETKPELVIGNAIEHDENQVAILRADGSRVDALPVEVLAEILEDEEPAPEPGLLAEAERRQEEEERKRAKRRPLPAAAPDPEVVAAVIRRDQERGKRVVRAATPRVQEVPDFGEPEGGATAKRRPKAGAKTGKTARKRQKRAERQRTEDSLRREATQMVRNFEAGGFDQPRKKKRRRRDEEGGEMHEGPRLIEVQDSLTVEELAIAAELTVNDVILDLMDMDVLATKNHSLDVDVIRQLMDKYGIEVRSVIPEEELLMSEEADDPASLVPRAPVITVMGHVDHGKTSFLDVVREANVAEGEAGGITQHIAAYDVTTSQGSLTFLDTPGHEAFTAMRARGAGVTDIVVLVVAADDGVRPQTVEAIDHAKAAEVPIVVAINKIDKPGAQPERVRQELSQHNLLAEEWGGTVIMKEISAKTKEGIEDFLELLALQAESMELKANPNKRARGAVVESEMTVGQGPVAWVLVQGGTLKLGDSFLCGETFGRVRTLTNSQGKPIESAGPSVPVLVTGFHVPPQAGDIFVSVEEERAARSVAEQRASVRKQREGGGGRKVTLEDFHLLMAQREQKILNIILKADVQGSVDALRASLQKLGNEEVGVNVVHGGVGGVNESDVLLASASEAVIIGFHVTAAARIKKLSEQEGVEIRTYRIIYEAIDEIQKALEGMLAPEERQIINGHAEIRAVFRSSALGNIAGCYVTDGEVQRNSLARLVRDDVVIYEGKISSLKRNKDDAKSVATGYECGIKIDGYDDIRDGDVIEAYHIVKVAKTLA
jgi:translation initiation factor IF-2